MSTIQSSFITITCDGVNDDNVACERNVTFAATQQDQVTAFNANPWLKNARIVQGPTGAKFTYCSDRCEASGIRRDKHGAPSEIVTATGQSQVELAAKAAASAAAAQAAIKQGSGIEIVPG